MSRPRTVSDLLSFLTAHEHQLESDRALVKQMVIAKVDSEFDVLLAKVRAHKAELQVVIRSQSVSNDSIVQVENNNDDNIAPNVMDVDQALPSTSNRKGRKRISDNVISQRRADSSRHVCIYPGCGKAFPDDAKLAVHERTHTGARPFSCAWPDCHYDDATRNHVVRHIRRVHFKLPLNQKDQRALNITDHRDPKRWIRVNQQLVSRRLTHANIQFYSNSNVAKVNLGRNKAKNPNSQVYRYVCRSPGCKQSFKISSGRISHERAIHLKAKPYYCTWPGCDLTSAERSQVTKHIRTVHFRVPQTLKLQSQLAIIDDRDPSQWVSVNQDEANRRLE